jgi:hypothetical protein
MSARTNIHNTSRPDVPNHIHVNCLVTIATNTEAHRIKAMIETHVKIDDKGIPELFLGMSFKFDQDEKLMFTQTKVIEKLVQIF